MDVLDITQWRSDKDDIQIGIDIGIAIEVFSIKLLLRFGDPIAIPIPIEPKVRSCAGLPSVQGAGGEAVHRTALRLEHSNGGKTAQPAGLHDPRSFPSPSG